MAWSVAVAVASAAAVACSALVGVEDVRLRRTADGAAADSGKKPGNPENDGATPGEAIVQVALGYLHTCARKGDGKVSCWGDNGAGQLGDSVPFDGGARAPALVPQDVPGIDDAVQLASGVSHSCVVRRSGTVSCWGINTSGQLGGSVPRSSSPVDVTGITTAVAITCGTSFTCAVLMGGTVSCWGANSSGQLGDGTKIARPTAAPVSQLTGVISLAAAESHACAVVAGGAVKCWGRNADGQLGNGTTVDSLVPTPLGALAGVAQIAAASRFTCARLTSGQLNCWGANADGQLGTGTSNLAPNPTPAITNVADAIAIGVGYNHACAVRRTGDVVCWGAAGSGQVGSGQVPADASVPSPTAVVGLTGALDVSTGGNHSCATTGTGAVLCWGNNVFGQLGDGTTQSAYTAVSVTTVP